jgi:hypothetical protein
MCAGRTICTRVNLTCDTHTNFCFDFIAGVFLACAFEPIRTCKNPEKACVFLHVKMKPSTHSRNTQKRQNFQEFCLCVWSQMHIKDFRCRRSQGRHSCRTGPQLLCAAARARCEFEPCYARQQWRASILKINVFR